MIKARTALGTDVWVSLTNDCGMNQGGYYCVVYLDDLFNSEVDNFVIQADDLIWTYTTVEDAVYDYMSGVVEY